MRICPALKKAKITDPNSRKGVEFCIESCPYPDCIAVDNKILHKIKMAREKSKTKRLHKNGLPIEEIAIKIGKSVTTVQRYLR